MNPGNVAKLCLFSASLALFPAALAGEETTPLPAVPSHRPGPAAGAEPEIRAAARAIKQRSEVGLEETWDLSGLYADFDAWRIDLKELPAPSAVRAEIASRFLGRLHESKETLLEFLAYRESLFRQGENLYTYARLRQSEDLANPESSAALGQVSQAVALLSAEFSFLASEILAIEELEAWAKDPLLADYALMLEALLEGKEHILGAKETALLSQLAPIFAQFTEIFSKWSNVDLRFPDVLDGKGDAHPLSDASYGPLMAHPDRVLRAHAFETYFKTLSAWRQTMGTNLAARFQLGSTIARIRGYDGFLHSSLDPDGIPVALYDGLISSVREHLPLLHRSMELRRDVLGLPAVTHFDRYVLLSGNELRTFTWEEACRIVLASLAPLGEEYVQVATKGLLQERWADYCENTGKRSGAFSSGTYDSRPYLSMTWKGSLDNVFTLAHELGHSMHSYLSHSSQPYPLGDYTIFVAEVASTLNEALLSHFLRISPEEDLARAAVDHSLKGFQGTLLTQTLFAAFEHEAAGRSDRGEPLGPDVFDEIYLRLTTEWAGDAAEHSPLIAHGWMRIPHFYNTFYVYKYATSYCASASLFRRLMDPKTAVQTKEQILTLLRTGGSKTPLETLLAAGVDFSTPTPVREAFQGYGDTLAAASRLFLQKP